MKVCFKCKENKSFDLFFKHSQTNDGHHSWCKDCCAMGDKKGKNKANSTIEGKAKIFLRNAKIAAKKRNQEFSLEISDIVEFWQKQQMICAYSGLLMTLETCKLNTVSIERINSDIGYTKANTILVCNAINRMKSNFSYEDFYLFCSSVTQFLGDDQLKLAVGEYK